MSHDMTIDDDIVRLWKQGYGTQGIADILNMHEYEVERLLHAELERRRRLREETAL